MLRISRSAFLRLAPLILVLAPGQAFAITITFLETLDHPLANDGTRATGVSGDRVVGWYGEDLPSGGEIHHGFVYDGSSYTTLDHPSQMQPGGVTQPQGIDGSNIVGGLTGFSWGFLYDGSSFTDVVLPQPSSPPFILGSIVYDIDGANMVGLYGTGVPFDETTYVFHGYLYDGSTFTTLDHPLTTTNSFATGIDDNRIVGDYVDSTGMEHGYLYDGSSYATIDHPLATGGTFVGGISGNYIVGSYRSASGRHGFLYDGSTFTTVDNPLGTDTHVDGIDGNTIVGYFRDGAGLEHGFIAEIPEPSTWTLLSMAGICLTGVMWARLRSR
ncbi:MAG: hypothetical protein WD063_01165 [Pirellulales bacterium]